VRGRYRVRDRADESGIRRAGFGQMVDGLALIEASHFNREFDRCTVAVDSKRPIGALRDRNDAAVDLRRKLAIYPYLFVAGGLPLRQRRIIQKRKPDGAFDLQRAVAFEKDRCCVGIDSTDKRMRRGIRKEREDALLRAGVGRNWSCHARAEP
jgi:hypothetical protein